MTTPNYEDLKYTAGILGTTATEKPKPDMVNHPPHYRGPEITCPNCSHKWRLECIAVIRSIRDGRLFNAMKYIWRVAFGGKYDDVEDIGKARWYLTDWLENKI